MLSADARMRAPNSNVEKQKKDPFSEGEVSEKYFILMLTKGWRSIEYAPRSDERIVL